MPGKEPMMRYNLILLSLLVTICGACTQQTDITFFVLVKSSNYSQDHTGELTQLNYHFFSEIFLTDGGSIEDARLTAHSRPSEPFVYVDRGHNFYVEGGHFNTVEELDAAYPNGEFTFDITTPTTSMQSVRLRLEGPDGRTDIPDPIRISLFQGGHEIHPLEIDPELDLTVRWSEYSNGRHDPRGIVDDMIFVVVADCFGERVFHTGLPFEGEYLRFDAREVVVEDSLLKPGMPYSAFVEFPHVVDSRIVNGVPGFTSYATATYIDLLTTGTNTDEVCPDAQLPMDTGQTDRMDSTGVSSR